MNVPKLRFSEFNEEWKCKKIGNISKIYDGTHETPNYTTSGVKFVSVENINNLLTTQKYVSKDDFDKYKIKPKINDIFMTRIGDIGTSNILLEKIDLAYYVSLALIRPNEEIYPMYLNQYIKSYFFQKELYNRTIHVAFPKKINTGEINNCLVNFPEIKEQEKISNVLALIDKKIELQSKKIEDLKLYKKGLFQKLNNLECNREVILSDIVDFQNGKGHEGIIDEDGEFILVNSKFISTEGKVIKKCSEQLTPLFKNDIVMVMSDLPNGKALSKCFYINENNRFSLNQRICSLRVKSDDNPKYLFYKINRNPYYIKFDDGVNQTNLKKEDVLNLKLLLPEIKLQNKISSVLNTLDNKIKLENNKLEKLQGFKKGLMQNMFV